MHKYLFLLVGILLFSTRLFAQATSSSPFSSYGLGEFGGLSNAQFAAIGGISSLSTDTTVLNTYNPSAYALLSHGQPLFGLGLSTKFSKYQSNNGNFNSSTTSITNFSLAVPFGKRFGIGGGLVPFTRRGYNIQNRAYAYDDSVTYSYTGSGSIDYGFFGIGYAPIRTDKTEFSIGVQGGLLFGGVTNNRISQFDATTTPAGIDYKTKRLRAFYYSVGLTYRHFLDAEKRKELIVTGTFSPQMSLRANLDYGLYASSDPYNYAYYDTIVESYNNRGSITFPSQQTIAVGYNFKPVNTENFIGTVYSLGLYAELDLMQWKNYKETFDGYTYSGYENTYTSRIGIQFQPNIDMQTKSKGLKYFEKVKYRVGAYYGTNPLLFNGSQIKSSGVTVGFGFPFMSNKSNSSINLSLQYGSTGNGRSGDLSEHFFNVGFGIVIAPSFYERWFKKYKLD